MKKAATLLLILIVVLVSIPALKAANTIDSRDSLYRALHYDLFFDFKFKSLREIRAEAKLDLYILKNVQEIVLDIKSYDIYSVSVAGVQSTFTFNDSNLIIESPSSFTQGDTLQISVNYGGSTHSESAGFGGFFFKPPYAYNIGVAFNEIPHNYGRVWYPCLDYFTSRSTYTTRTLTYGSDISVSAGELTVDSVVAGDTIYREWEMQSAIPSYLHSLSIAPYEMIGWQHQGLQSSFPVELYSLAADTTKLRNSFVDLDSAIQYFEESYHPFMWQKVGYSVLPMNGGAMEHACNIAYPRFAVNGNTDYETLMAHELAHSWWGNLVTCESASEMWLNEGWASFSEYLFLEKRYGWKRAVEELQGVQYNVLKNAHQREGKYRAVAGIEEPYIYGLHVYRKGSMVAWSLRTYLGEDFESTINQFFADNQFKSINSSYLQQELERISGKSLSDFFDSWVFEPGFLDFFIDDMSFQNNNAQTTVSQMQTGTNKGYKGVPIELEYLYDDYSSETVSFANAGTALTSNLTREPVHVVVNPNNKLALACTWDEEMLNQNGAVQLNRVDIELTVQGISDSAWLRVEQHWSEAPIKPANAANLKVRIAPNRHWRLYSLSDDPISMNATLRYDGRAAAGLDPDLNGISEDSLLLLFKPLYGGEWVVHSNYSKNDLGSSQDAFGIFSINSVTDGNYAIGIRDKSASINAHETGLKIKLYPNPSLSNLRIESPFSAEQSIRVTDINGKIQFEKKASNSMLELNTDTWNSGVYMIEVSKGTQVLREKFVKN